MWLLAWAVICFWFCAIVRATSGCVQQTSWRPMSVEERLYKSSIVAYGRNEQHIRVNGSSGNVISTTSIFRVYCQLKIYRAGLGSHIIIHDILPSDLCAESRMKVGHEYIVALRRLGNGNFGYHNVNYPQSAVFRPTNERLKNIVNICGLTSVREVRGKDAEYQPACPVPTVNDETCIVPSNVNNVIHSHLTLSSAAVMIVYTLLGYS